MDGRNSSLVSGFHRSAVAELPLVEIAKLLEAGSIFPEIEIERGSARSPEDCVSLYRRLADRYGNIHKMVVVLVPKTVLGTSKRVLGISLPTI
jgi:hypothetical protein